MKDAMNNNFNNQQQQLQKQTDLSNNSTHNNNNNFIDNNSNNFIDDNNNDKEHKPEVFYQSFTISIMQEQGFFYKIISFFIWLIWAIGMTFILFFYALIFIDISAMQKFKQFFITISPHSWLPKNKQRFILLIVCILCISFTFIAVSVVNTKFTQFNSTEHEIDIYETVINLEKRVKEVETFIAQKPNIFSPDSSQVIEDFNIKFLEFFANFTINQLKIDKTESNVFNNIIDSATNLLNDHLSKTIQIELNKLIEFNPKNQPISPQDIINALGEPLFIAHLENIIVKNVKDTLANPNTDSNLQNNLSLNYLEQIIKSQLEIFGADKIGRPDFALASAGASIVNQLTSYNQHPSTKTNFFVSLTSPRQLARSPDTILDTNTEVGNCWLFEGNSAYVTIKLSQAVIPTAFTVDHVSPLVAHAASRRTAPQDFNVWARQKLNDEPIFLGDFNYQLNKSSIQTFEIKIENNLPFNYITFNITSNHGSKNTCIYRFRVHANN
eukprot:TRINITY_DN715_c0_g1_i1.p1 TRINITY_DN715_c0_g1~~TRINITY_DN715_c0_g1_i1.p1  ORF type:complete len:497 (-),score=162.26 TRINITY_DN715_c0_g1_i1:122-1612(-)